MAGCSPGSDLVLLAATLAMSISTNLSADDSAVLGGFFNALGDNLAVIASQKQLCKEERN